MTQADRYSGPRRGPPAISNFQRSIRWLLVLAIAFIASACAHRATPELPRSPAPQVPKQLPEIARRSAPSPGFSWSVAGKATAITLVGSIHVGFEGLYPLPEPVESAFRQSTALALELALDQVPPERVAEIMMAQAALPKGQTLHDCLSDKTWLRYQAFASDHTDQAQFFDKFRPWFVAVFLSVEQDTLDGYDPNQGIDLHFLNQRGNRRVIGIEKAEEQLKILADLPAATQELMLSEQLDAMNRQSDELEAVVKLWKASDADGLAREMFAQFEEPEYAPVYDALIVQRKYSDDQKD